MILIIIFYLGGITGTIIAFLGVKFDKYTQRSLLNIILWSIIWPSVLYKMYNNTWED